MLVDRRGEVGMGGSSGMDKDGGGIWGLSSARTKSAEVPLLEYRFKRGASRILLGVVKSKHKDASCCNAGKS